MKNTFSKLTDEVHVPLFRRYNTFSGTNDWTEWSSILSDYLKKNVDYCDSQLISNYEQKFAEKVGAQYAFGYSTGRMGLYSILEALGIGSGDEVIIPAFTCVVVPNAIIYRRATPVYVDIAPKTFNIDISQVEKKITSKTRALYAQHTFGLVCDVEGLNALGAKYGIPVIEDGAHALGASWKGAPVGSLTDVAFFSTDHTKILNTLYGGMVTTNNEDIAKKIKLLYDRAPFLSIQQQKNLCRTFLIEFPLFRTNFYGMGRFLYKLAHKMGLIFIFNDELKTQKPTEYSYPAKICSFQAKLGVSQLQKLENNLKHRKELGILLEKRFHWLKEELTPDISNHTFLRYSFLVKDREKFIRNFKTNFDLGIWFQSIAHGRQSDFEKIGYQAGSCPIAEDAAKHIVNFPTHEGIDINFLLEKIDKSFKQISSNIK
jgi:perosamine synthetase